MESPALKKVPLLDLATHHDALNEQLLAAIKRVLASNTFILGPEVEAFEEELATYCGTSHAIGVSSGTDAILIALMALGVAPGDEVVTSPYSFFATAGVVARLGAKPVFVDINPHTYNLDSSKLESVLTSKTKAIVPVHLFGQVADMESILAIADRHGVSVVEDAAQAIGAVSLDGRRTGSLGIAACLSFFPSKNLGALGDGGAVITNNQSLARTLKILRTHGAEPKYYHKMIGGNFRLDAVQAATLRVKLEHLDRWTLMRQRNAVRYCELFVDSGLVSRGLLTLPIDPSVSDATFRAPCGGHIFNQFVVRVANRDALRDYMKRKGVASEVYYPVPFHLQECFRYLGYGPGDFPEAERAAKESLAIPIYPELREDQARYVVQTIAEFYAAT